MQWGEAYRKAAELLDSVKSSWIAPLPPNIINEVARQAVRTSMLDAVLRRTLGSATSSMEIYMRLTPAARPLVLDCICCMLLCMPEEEVEGVLEDLRTARVEVEEATGYRVDLSLSLRREPFKTPELTIDIDVVFADKKAYYGSFSVRIYVSSPPRVGSCICIHTYTAGGLSLSSPLFHPVGDDIDEGVLRTLEKMLGECKIEYGSFELIPMLLYELKYKQHVPDDTLREIVGDLRGLKEKLREMAGKKLFSKIVQAALNAYERFIGKLREKEFAECLSRRIAIMQLYP